VTGPGAALLRYHDGGEVPLHRACWIRTYFCACRFPAG
jgi:hypothetical protein